MSNLASTSRVQMRYIKEATFGVTPLTGNPRNLRMTGESLNFDLTKEESKEVRGDRQMGGSATVGATSGGDVNIHMQYGEYDPLFEGLMMNPFSVFGVNGEGAAFAAAYAAGSITAAVATTGASLFTLLQPGQYFRIAHPGNANNGKVFKNSLTVAPTSTVITLDATTPAIVVASTAGATLQTSRLTNGVTESSFTFEMQAADVGQFLAFRGQYVSKFNLKFASGALLDGGFTLLGKDGGMTAVTTLPGTPIASRPFDIQSCVVGTGFVVEGGTRLTNTFIKSMDFNFDNALRTQDAVFNLGAVGIGLGTIKVSGSIMLYFRDQVMYNKFRNDVYTALEIPCQDSAGNGYVISMPRVQLAGAKLVASGKDQDFMLDCQYTAYADDANANPLLRQTVFIDRLGVALT